MTYPNRMELIGSYTRGVCSDLNTTGVPRAVRAPSAAHIFAFTTIATALSALALLTPATTGVSVVQSRSRQSVLASLTLA